MFRRLASIVAALGLMLMTLRHSATDNQTLTVTFQNAGTITVSPDQVKASYDLHYDVYTNGNDTLLAASTSGDTGTLVLKDICGS